MGSEGTDCHLGYSLSSAEQDQGSRWHPLTGVDIESPLDSHKPPATSLPRQLSPHVPGRASHHAPRYSELGRLCCRLGQLDTCHWAAWWRRCQMVVTGGQGS